MCVLSPRWFLIQLSCLVFVSFYELFISLLCSYLHCIFSVILERFSRAGPRGRGREWATLGEHPLTWLLSNNRLEKVPFVSVLHTSSNRLLLSNQDKGCTPSVAHFLPLPLGPALLNLWITICFQAVWLWWVNFPHPPLPNVSGSSFHIVINLKGIYLIDWRLQ